MYVCTYARSRARRVAAPTSAGYGLPPTTTIAVGESHKHRAPVAPRAPNFCNRDVCPHHTESNAPPTDLPTSYA